MGRQGVLISAYAASPAHSNWDPALEGELLRALCALPGVIGLEIPWLGRVHPHDNAWFLKNAPTGAQLSVTALPYIMQRCAADPQYGIASPDAEGRASALGDLRRLAADVRVLTEQSAADVALVALHTAPSGRADAAALADSLNEIAGFDWSEAQLVIEHCDGVMPDRPFEKGFLPLAEEIEAISATGTPIGVWLNWGRSVIELRDADAVTAQISDAASSGYLTGLTFSGAGAIDGPYGAAWIDAHLPLLSADPGSGSLLDDDRVRAAVRAAGSAPWLGVKVSRRPTDRTAEDVTCAVASNLDVLNRIRATG